MSFERLVQTEHVALSASERATADSERRDDREVEAVPKGAPISRATSVGHGATPGRTRSMSGRVK